MLRGPESNPFSVPSKWTRRVWVADCCDPSGDLPNVPKKQTVGTVTASHKMLSLQALPSSLNAGLFGPRKGFWVTSGSLSPQTAASICSV